MKRYFYILFLILFIGFSFKSRKGEEVNYNAFGSQHIKVCSAIPISRADFENLKSPILRNNMGNSHFQISAKNKDSQKWFNYGLSLLHTFWHIEAYRVFKHILKTEPENAMAWWGVAMCQPGFGGDDNSEWETAIGNAVKFSANNCSQKEKDLIAATNLLINDGISKALASFNDLKNKYPKDEEINAFYFIVKRQNLKSQSDSDLLKAEIEDALKSFPKSIAIWHYYMHLMELRPDYKVIFPHLNTINELATQAPHMVHMPGHFYYLKGEYQSAVSAFENAIKIEKEFHREDNIPLALNQNYLHNLHFLALSYAELNNKEKAFEYAKQYSNITYSKLNPTDGNALMLLYEGRILPALVYLRFRDYQKANDELSFWINTSDFPINNTLVLNYLKTMRMYSEGMEAVKNGKEDLAIRASRQMKEFMQAFETEGLGRQSSVESRLINETYDIMQMAWYELIGWGVNMNTSQTFIEEPWIQAAELEKAIHYDEPPRLMYPLAESKAHLYKKRKNYKLMKVEIEKALNKRPKSKTIETIAFLK